MTFGTTMRKIKINEILKNHLRSLIEGEHKSIHCYAHNQEFLVRIGKNLDPPQLYKYQPNSEHCHLQKVEGETLKELKDKIKEIEKNYVLSDFS